MITNLVEPTNSNNARFTEAWNSNMKYNYTKYFLITLLQITNGNWLCAWTLIYIVFSFGCFWQKLADGTIVIKGAWCSIKRVIIPYAFEISICVFFVVPMSIISGLYVLIGLKLWRSRRGPARSNTNHLTVEPHRFTANRHSQTHVIRMLGKSSEWSGLFYSL